MLDSKQLNQIYFLASALKDGFIIEDYPLLLKFKGNQIYVFTSSYNINSPLSFEFSRVTMHISIPTESPSSS